MDHTKLIIKIHHKKKIFIMRKLNKYEYSVSIRTCFKQIDFLDYCNLNSFLLLSNIKY